MEILAIIPARGGSKSVPRKNIKLIGGKPLINYTIESAINCKHITRTIVSTDDQEIADISTLAGAQVPFLRPKYLATDTAGTSDVVLDLIEWLKRNENYTPDFICVLQCTTPMRSTEDIEGCIQKCIGDDCEYDVCFSVCETESSPYWMKTFSGGKLVPFLDATTIARRQDLPKVYELNGAVYVVKTSALVRSQTMHIQNVTGYVMPQYRSLDIDTPLDFEIAKMIMEKYL
ncbi:MAG: acylneuraminate cytidylyltransferase [Epulopiscium sp. Nele67-Bin004]|nr:MAG: acylneuraminate cytidylyltransferase [Epulopiscium sp. Nele67-Bin004]